MKKILLSISMFLMLLGPAWADAPPEDVVRSFYGVLIEPILNPTPRTPYQPEAQRVERFLSVDLRKTLRLQKAHEIACARKTPPGEKGYVLDQSPFFSGPDGAQAIRHLETTVTGRLARVAVELSYGDQVWTDTVALQHEKGRWGITNIFWSDGDDTVHLLRDFVHQGCDFDR